MSNKLHQNRNVLNGKPKVVHQKRVACFESDHDQEEVNERQETPDLTSVEFVGANRGTGKARRMRTGICFPKEVWSISRPTKSITSSWQNFKTLRWTTLPFLPGNKGHFLISSHLSRCI